MQGVEIVTWVRVLDFQLVSLKMIVAAMLRHSPLGITQPHLLQQGLITSRDVQPMYFLQPVRLMFCTDNAGAKQLAGEMRSLAIEMDVHGDRMRCVYEAMIVHDASELTPDASKSRPTHCLLYLNQQTFTDGGGVARIIQAAMQSGITMVLVQEQDVKRGACPFRTFLDTTPPELIEAKLYNTLAVPLYTTPEHRTVSIFYIARIMGAQPGGGKRATNSKVLRLVANCTQSWSSLRRTSSLREESILRGPPQCEPSDATGNEMIANLDGDLGWARRKIERTRWSAPTFSNPVRTGRAVRGTSSEIRPCPGPSHASSTTLETCTPAAAAAFRLEDLRRFHGDRQRPEPVGLLEEAAQ